MRKRRFAVGVMVWLVLGSAWAQQNGPGAADTSFFSLSLVPHFTMPLGRDTTVYAPGGGADLNAEYRLPSLPILFVGGGLGYSFVPLQAVTSISLMDAGLAAGLHYDLMPSLSLRAFASGGYFYAFINDGTGRGGGNPVASGGVDLSYSLTPELGIGVGAAYRYYFGLYNDLAVTLGVSYNFQSRGGQAAAPLQQRPAQPKPTPIPPAPQAQPRPGARGSTSKSSRWETFSRSSTLFMTRVLSGECFCGTPRIQS